MYKGQLVNLRLLTLSDIDFITDFLNQEHVMEYRIEEMPRFTYKEQLVKKFKENMEKRNNDNEVHMVIETKDNKVIGEIGFNRIFWKNGIGYMYHYMGDKNYIEGGYSEEAIRLFLEFAFKEQNIRKVKTLVLANDVNKIDACRINGFQVEVLYKEEVLCHGNYLDVYEMAILKDEYF